MKKTMTMIVLLLALFGVRAQAQSLRVWMDDMNVVADGQTVTYMTVYMTDPDNLYSGFQMGITVPEGISIHQVKSGRVMVNDAKLNEFRFEGLTHSLTVNMADSKTIKLGCADTGQNAEFYPDDADGNIVEELFTIGLVGSPEMVNGEYTVEMWDVEMIHQDATGVKPSNTNLTAKMTVTGGQDAAPLTIPYNLTAAGYGTIILPFDAELPEGVKAYTCTAIDGTVVVTEEQASIKANTPMLLQGVPGQYEFQGISSAEEDSYTQGILTGVYPATAISSGYVLQTQQGVTGFYRVENAQTVPANRCYLTMSGNAKLLRLDFADSIENIMANSADKTYDLSGRRSAPNTTGVKIMSGRKVIKK